MSDFEQMPMEPEVQENLFIQILQDMEKLDQLRGVFIVMIMAVIAFAIYYSYKNLESCNKIHMFRQQLGQYQEDCEEDDH